MGGTGDFKQWILPLCHFLLIYSVALNRKAYHRWILLMSGSIVVASMIGGTMRSGAEYSGRLYLESVAGSYGDPNELAYGAAAAAIGLLFYSLRTKGWLRPAIWGLVVVLVVIILQTLSRGGLATFVVAFMCFLLAVAGARGMRLKGLIGVMFFVGVAAVGGHVVTQQLTDVRTRFGEGSVRIENFIYVWHDLPGTIIKGKGGGEHGYVEHTQVEAHNTFFYMHLAWGGPAAYLFLAWMGTVFIRLVRMLSTSTAPLHLRMEVTAMLFVAFAACMMSNNGLLIFGTVTALALADKYLVSFSGTAVRQQRYLDYQQRSLLQHAAPSAQPLARV
jgi:O-antigen ligase